MQADPTRVIQVLSNLISNGLKYSPEGSPIEVQLHGGSGRDVRPRVRVLDHGRGIPADQLDRVFDKFHRVEDPLRMTTSGTGLGLFIARRLAGAMGGTLSVESTLGKGATFSFRAAAGPRGRGVTDSHQPSATVPFGLPGPRSRPTAAPAASARSPDAEPPSDTQGELSHSK